MILALFLGVLYAIFAATRPRSPALVLLAIYLVSLLSGLFIDNDYQLTSTVEWINFVFVAGMLTLMIWPWNAFSFGVEIDQPNERRLNRLTWTLLSLNAIGFVVFTTTFYLAFTSVTDYSAFKNEGEAADFYSAIPINRHLLLFAIYANATAVFLVPLHFYHLHKERIWVSLLCLLFSLNLVLEGITIFSRSPLVLYGMLYLLYLPFFYRRIQRKERRVLQFVGVVAVAMFGTIFYVITNNRFATYLLVTNTDDSTSTIQNPLLYSIFDYASQWYANGMAVLSQYSFRTLNGGLSFPLFTTLGNKFGIIDRPPELIPIQLAELWGDRYDKFVGVVPNLVFDFGYAGTTIFLLLYAMLVFKMRPIRGTISVGTLLMLGPLFLLPAMGILNSVMKLNSYNLLIVYSVPIYAYLYRKRRSASVTVSVSQERGQ